MSITLASLAEYCDCVVEGDPETEVISAASPTFATAGSLTLALDAQHAAEAAASGASAVLLPLSLPCVGKACLRSRNPRLSWAKALDRLAAPPRPAPTAHPSSHVDPDACVAPSASVGPHCCIGPGSRIGERCILDAGVVIGADVVIGEDTVIQANAVVRDGCVLGRRNRILPGAVIGSDGFGFARDGVRHHRIPQIGIVRTGDDVEIGANSTVDRAALDETTIGDGVKIDNLVHVAHNVQIGANAMIVALVGIGGSSRLGDNVMMGGQAGAADHITIGTGAIIASGSGVIGDVAPGEVLMGYPARPRREFLRALAHLYRQVKRKHSSEAALDEDAAQSKKAMNGPAQAEENSPGETSA